MKLCWQVAEIGKLNIKKNPIGVSFPALTGLTKLTVISQDELNVSPEMFNQPK